MNKVLVYEAKAAYAYWDFLTRIFHKLYPEFNFNGRRNKTYSWNNNASDEINAMLNYGYAILESLTRKCINAVGLDSSIGYLHELKIGNTPLVFDLQELLRWLVDLSVIQLLEEKKLKKSDFIVTEDYHTRLREHTAKNLLNRIKVNFNMRVPHRKLNFSYENILLDNTKHLANYLQDKSKEFKLRIPALELERDDNLDMRNLIMNMTPEERKKLRINKSTLWYMQQNLRKGKKIKIYEKVKSKIT